MGFALTAALFLALAFAGARVSRRAKLARRLAALPGGSSASAIEVAAFTDVDEHLRRRHCPCGGSLESIGERSEESGGRRLRVARLECRLCERVQSVFFDVSGLYH